jgi:hypothetical protein
MENKNKYEGIRHWGFSIKLFLCGVLVGIIILFTIYLCLYGVRNKNYNEVGLRFVLNNATVKSEVGEIIGIDGFGSSDRISRQQINTSSITNDQKTTKLPKPNFYSAIVRGKKKTIIVKLHFKTRNVSEYSREPTYYFVDEARYSDAEGIWREIPIGWFENDILLFK